MLCVPSDSMESERAGLDTGEIKSKQSKQSSLPVSPVAAASSLPVNGAAVTGDSVDTATGICVGGAVGTLVGNVGVLVGKPVSILTITVAVGASVGMGVTGGGSTTGTFESLTVGASVGRRVVGAVTNCGTETTTSSDVVTGDAGVEVVVVASGLDTGKLGCPPVFDGAGPRTPKKVGVGIDVLGERAGGREGIWLAR
jgi:hypothetical protein